MIHCLAVHHFYFILLVLSGNLPIGNGFLDKAELGQDKGSEAFLVALARIIRSLKLEAPAGAVR